MQHISSILRATGPGLDVPFKYVAVREGMYTKNCKEPTADIISALAVRDWLDFLFAILRLSLRISAPGDVYQNGSRDVFRNSYNGI